MHAAERSPEPLTAVRTETKIAWALVFAAVLILLALGIAGIGTDGPRWSDFDVMFRGGGLWVDGEAAYLIDEDPAIFAYPPQAGALFMPYDLLGRDLATAIHVGLNLASLGVIVFVANEWFIRVRNPRSMTIPQALAISLMLALWLAGKSIVLGQLSIIMFAVALLSWRWRSQGRWLEAGLALGVATIKPQWAVLLILWYLLEREFRILVVGGITSIAIAVPTFIATGPFSASDDWLESLDRYREAGVNEPGYYKVLGLDSFLHTIFDNPVNTYALLAAPVLALYYFRDRLPASLTFLTLMAAGLTLGYSHDADAVAVAPLFAWLIIAAFKQPRRLPLAALLVGSFFLPSAVLEKVSTGRLLHWLTFTIAAGSIVLIRWVLQDGEEAQARHAEEVLTTV